MSRFRVAIVDHGFQSVNLERAILAEAGAEVVEGQCKTEGDVIAVAAGADAIICDYSAITRRVLEALPTVRVVSEYGIGVDNIDVKAATDLGVWVANVPGFCTEEVADHTLMMILAASRQLLACDRSARTGGWPSEPAIDSVRRLSGQTLGLIGFGRIAKAVAVRAKAFGLRVVAWSPSLTPSRAADSGVTYADLDLLIAESDFVSLHVPSTPETGGLIDGRRLGAMRPTAWLINTGRGALVDEEALVAALESGQIAGAALDVRRNEPPGQPDPLATAPNTILTPHRAYYSEESLRDLQDSAARNVAAVLTRGGPVAAVNRPDRPRPTR